MIIVLVVQLSWANQHLADCKRHKHFLANMLYRAEKDLRIVLGMLEWNGPRNETPDTVQRVMTAIDIVKANEKEYLDALGNSDTDYTKFGPDTD